MKSIFRLSIFVLLAAASTLLSRNPALQRTILQKNDMSESGREAVVVRIELAPVSFAGRHTHPGEEITYVLEGEGEILIDGQAPLKIKAGDSFFIPARVKHDAHNTGKLPLKMAAVYVVDKDQPLATAVS